MPRLPLIDPQRAPDSVRELLASTPLALLRMVAHAESAFRPWLRYSNALLTRLELEPLLRELAILQVAHLSGSAYEWVQHVVIARSVGASDAQIEAIQQGRHRDPSLSEEQALLLGFAREVILDGCASERAVADLSERLGARAVVELLLVIGHYLAIARLIGSTGLEPEAPVLATTPPGERRGLEEAIESVVPAELRAASPKSARRAAALGSERGRLAGKVAIVTGAGQVAGLQIGNGRATAILFARQGARVALLDRERAAAEETAREIEAAGGVALVIEGDVGVEDDCRAAVAACNERFGGLDILHHNVGVALGDGWCEGIEMSEWERIMRINAGGALMMAKAALPVLREQGSGVITNVSSIAALVAGVARTNNPPHAYKMSKAALNALTVSLAQGYAQHGVRVNAILPGLIDTPMGVDTVARALELPRERYAAIRDESVPLKGGMGSAWDVANAALFLASDEARFITGVLLAVDGGQSTRVG